MVEKLAPEKVDEEEVAFKKILALDRAAENGIALTFDDVLIVPGHSEVVPRDISLETILTPNIRLGVPFISADMDTVTEPRLAIEMAKYGGIGFLWKHPDFKVQAKWVGDVKRTLNARIDTPVTIRPDQKLEDVEETLRLYGDKFSSLIVVDDSEKVVGLVNRRKIKFASSGDLVSKFMVKTPRKSKIDFTTKQAYSYMKRKEISHLVLVDSTGKLKGLYCFTDVESLVEGHSRHNRDERGQLRVGANVGVNDYDRVEALLKKNCDVLLVGTAHGDSKNVIDTIREIKTRFSKYNPQVVAGNVSTYEGAKRLFEAGADAVKVGIGPGSICTTRIVTGAGMPQIKAVYDAAKAGFEYGRPVIADGGIRNSGDVTKAIAAGASSVMMGGVFASTEEAPGEETTVDGQKFKVYRGMGSLEAMRDAQTGSRYGQEKAGEKSVPEGIEGRVPITGRVVDIIFQYSGGLKAGMGYAGTESIEELIKKGDLVRETIAGVVESHPHDVRITSDSPNYTRKA